MLSVLLLLPQPPSSLKSQALWYTQVVCRVRKLYPLFGSHLLLFIWANAAQFVCTQSDGSATLLRQVQQSHLGLCRCMLQQLSLLHLKVYQFPLPPVPLLWIFCCLVLYVPHNLWNFVNVDSLYVLMVSGLCIYTAASYEVV